jgi:predicted dehydrogenase
VKLVDKEKKVLSDFTKDTDDIIYFIGTLKNDIPLSFSLRAGGAFKDTPELDWRIYGEEGEIRVTSSSGFLSVGTDDMKIELHDFQKDSVEQVEIPADELDKLGRPARNVARIYRALAAGEVNCSFEDAVQGHELIEKLYKENGYTEA